MFGWGWKSEEIENFFWFGWEEEWDDENIDYKKFALMLLLDNKKVTR